ncbi:hypothetical protein [Paenibacillus polymyxa]|uniref:hypothetical protein n=1 Tax=Paenibacillus polymyxa TaxID=1406 RepID=UPI0032AEAA84
MRTKFVKDDKNRYVRELVNVKRDRNKKVIPVVDDDSIESSYVQFRPSKGSEDTTTSTYSSSNCATNESKETYRSNDYYDASSIIPIILNTLL